ncbi:MAG: hypothetical protein ACP5VC_13790 [Bryobacteraceae bacterium]
MSVFGWVVAGAAGWFWVRALLPRRRTRPAWIHGMLEASLGLAWGAGATASLFFALLWAGVKPATAAWAADGALTAFGVLLWFLLRRPPEEEAPPAARYYPMAWLAAVAAGASLAAFFAATLIYLRANPQGDGDAWSSWNTRARFLTHAGLWRNAVSPEIVESHPEAPLLWPAAVARVWAENGAMSQAAPQAGAFFMSLALAGLFGAALLVETDWPWTCVGFLCLLSLGPFWRAAPSQYPDVPLALFVLGAMVTAAAAERAAWSMAGLALSGMLASFAAFTRNEGIAFALSLGATLMVAARTRVLAWLAGAFPGLLLTGLFHSLLAPPSAGSPWAGLPGFSQFVDALAALVTGIWRLGELPAHPLLLLAILYFAFRPGRPGARRWIWYPPVLLVLAEFGLMWGSSGDASSQLASPPEWRLFHAAPALLLVCLVWLWRSSGQRSADPPRRPESLSGSVRRR